MKTPNGLNGALRSDISEDVTRRESVTGEVLDSLRVREENPKRLSDENVAGGGDSTPIVRYTKSDRFP